HGGLAAWQFADRDPGDLRVALAVDEVLDHLAAHVFLSGGGTGDAPGIEAGHGLGGWAVARQAARCPAEHKPDHQDGAADDQLLGQICHGNSHLGKKIRRKPPFAALALKPAHELADRIRKGNGRGGISEGAAESRNAPTLYDSNLSSSGLPAIWGRPGK